MNPRPKKRLQRAVFRACERIGERKGHYRLKRFWTYAAVLILAAGCLIAGLCMGEETDLIPPSPEPPVPEGKERPTPAPTEVPEQTLIDHIHFPDELPDFHFEKNASLLEIWIPNIRDADEAVLTYQGQVYMIDCGDNRAANRGVLLLRQLGIDRVDILFISHPHHDHTDGLRTTFQQARILEIQTCFPDDSTESGINMAAAAEELGIRLLRYGDRQVFTMGDGAVRLQFFQNADPTLDINNRSAQTMVRYGERSIFFMADMEKNGQISMLGHVAPEELKCDIVKYPHHGKSAMYEAFFNALQPRLAVVTSVTGRGDTGQTYLTWKHVPSVFTSVKGKFTHLATDGQYWLCEYVDVKSE